MAPDYPQNYYGTSSHQTPQQQYGNYQTQRNTSTGGTGQYSSSNQPVSQPFQSYSTQAHDQSGTSYNLSDYAYGSTNYGASSGTTGASRNPSSAELQNLAYASVVHDSVQRANAQSNSTNQGFSASPSQHASYSSNSYPNYGQQQHPRPKSVNALTGRNSQRSPAVDARQLNPSGLPLPKTGYRPSAAPSSSSQQRTITSPPTTSAYQAPQTTQQPSAHTQDHSSRALPNLSHPTQSAAYNWSGQPHTRGDASRSRDFETVDPTQVYDPWPEIERKREAARAAKALEERAQAERQRREREKAEQEAEEARQVEEARLAEERRKAEEEAEAERQRVEEERRKEAEAVQQAKKAQEQRQKKANTKSKMSKAPAAAAAASSSVRASPQDVEAQMRALMAQMRELNNEDPALLAKIWEEERRTHQPNQTASQSVQSPTPTTQQLNRTVGQKKGPSAPPKAPATTHSAVAQTPTGVPPGQPSHQLPQQTQQPPAQPPQRATQQQRVQQPIPKTRQFPKRKPPKGTTSWPPDKIEQISKAASDWLNAIPENHSKHVSPREISDILNGNPKYIELCEYLESQGLKLERAAFARALLSAVPDINKPSQTQAPAASQSNDHMQQSPARGLNNTVQPGHQNNQAPGYSDLPANRVSTVGEHLAGGQYSYPPPEHTRLRSPYFVPTTAGTPMSMPQAIPTPPPQVPVAPMPYTRHDHQNSGSRQGSSQREDSQNPVTKADAARKRNFSDIVDLTLLSDDEEPRAKKQDYNNDIAPAWAAPPDSVFHSNPSHQGNFYAASLPTMVQADDRMKNMEVVEPLNRKYALRRSTYEVKSIARDVLLATGKHPEMRPLNGHLDILRESFKKVDTTADLSTLRWDLIDPGDPPPEALKPAVVELEDEDADDEEDDAPKEEPRPRQLPPVSKATAPTPDRPAGGLLHASSSSRIPHQLPSSASVSKKRGRPSKLGAAGAVGARATPSSRDRDRDPASSTLTGTPNNQLTPMSGYAAFRKQQLGPDGTPLPKKKGRPVGWRKSVHSKEALAQTGGLTPQPASASRPKSGPRTAQTPSGVVVINSRSPSVASVRRGPASFSVYKCQWENCAAELHNLQTLRKHVSKFHHSKNAHNKWPCFWDQCQENERTMDPRTGKPNGFSTEEDFKDHMDFAHIGPNAWKLGDGHAGGLSESHDSASEAYLSDRRTGRTVTPLIAAPSKERVDLAAAATSPVRRGPGRPKVKSDEQKARDAQAALEQKKRLVGPGIDRGGARLANEKRRLGFLDDEDFEEVVSDDD